MKNIKLNLQAGKASINPPIGPILGQYGINLILFCKEYNKLTSHYKNLIIPVSVIINDDKSFKLKLHTPSITYLIKKYSINNIISINNFYKIIFLKSIDLYPLPLDKILKIILGTLKTTKIKIKI